MEVKDKHFYLLIPLVGLLLFGKVIFFGLTYSDDNLLIISNSDILSDILNLPRLFTQDVFISLPNTNLFFRPMLNISLMLDAQISGIEPWMYHVTNIVLHVLCSVLIFRFLRLSQIPVIVAGFASLIFVVHPLLSSAVSWIPGRNDSLLALFALLALLSLKSYDESRSTRSLALHGLFVFLSLLTKESAIVIPVVSVLYLILVSPNKNGFRRLLPLASVWALGIIAWATLRSNVQQNFSVNQSFGDRFGHAFENLPSILLYLGKVIFPFNLSVYPNLSDSVIWWGIAAFVLFSVVAFRGGSERKVIIWGFLWFIMFLSPGLLIGKIFHEHRAYVPFVGLILSFAHFPAIRTFNIARPIQLVAAILVLCFFAGISFLHADNFKDRWSYVRNAYVKSPGLDDAYVGLAGYFMDDGKYDGAEQIIREGLAKNDKMKTVYRMLGDIYASRRENEKSEQAYRMELSLDPLDLLAYLNYGKLCLSLGRPDEAEKLWRTSVEVNPEYLLGYYYLANFYLREKDDPNLAFAYTQKIRERGSAVMPELINEIILHPKFTGTHSKDVAPFR